MDNIVKDKSITGFSLYYLSSGLLAASLFLTNWIGGAIFTVAWLINFYLWTLLKDELGTLPNLNHSLAVPRLLARFNLGNLALTVWAAALVLFQIFWTAHAWTMYPLALLAFIPSWWTGKSLRRLETILSRSELEFTSLSALEVLAQIDTVILDEVTTGEVVVEDILLADGIKEELFGKIIGTFLQALHKSNSVITGLNAHFKHAKTYPAKNIVTFSDTRNWSSMYLESIGTVFLGPAETLLKETPDFVVQTLEEGKRVLALAVSQDEHTSKELPETLFTLALLVLSEPIKEGLSELVSTLKEEDIQLKILTKEDPVRMANLSKRLGISIVPFDEVVSKQTLFGDLDSEQKTEICEYFATQNAIAYVGNLQMDVHCRISSFKEAAPHIEMPSSDLSLLAEAFQSVDEIRAYLP